MLDDGLRSPTKAIIESAEELLLVQVKVGLLVSGWEREEQGVVEVLDDDVIANLI